MTLPRLSTLGGLKEGDLYIERPADHALLAALSRGEYAYVLSSRQTGKTSLMSRTLRKLRESGQRCAKVDLGAIGTESDPSQWYLSLAIEIAEAVGCADAFAEEHFTSTRRRTPVQCFIRFLRDLVALSEKPLVIFIDEIEGFLKLPMRVTDDFLAAVRSCFNDRDREPCYQRLSFCLMGVCTPNELIRDERRTPFNVARSIDLEDFTWDNVRDGFSPVFAGMGQVATEILKKIYEWSNGHPYITHCLVEEVRQRHQDGALLHSVLIDSIVRERFLSTLSREQENFLEVERRLCLGQVHRVQRRLALYKSILGGDSVPALGQDLVQLELRLTGLVRELRVSEAPTHLVVRNRVFATLFDESWTPKLDPAKLDPALWLKDQIDRWIEFGRKDAFVLRGEEFLEAQKWTQAQPHLEPGIKEFLKASQRVDNRERRLRLNSLLFMTLWASSASFLLTPLLLDYWHRRAYPGMNAISALHVIPFLLGFPVGLLLDHRQMKSARMILIGLSLELVGSAIFLGDLFIQKSIIACSAVILIVIGQIILRPQPAVLLGFLYPRNDRRADLAFIVFYFFVNLGALIGPLAGAAMYKQYGWKGAVGTVMSGLALALYGFSMSYSAFSKLSFPLRVEPEHQLAWRQRRWQIVLLGTSLVVFWVSFYAFADFLGKSQLFSRTTDILFNNLATENVLKQGLSSESITPIFVILLAPILTALMYALRAFKIELTIPSRLAMGALVFSFLLLLSSTLGYDFGSAHIAGVYIALTFAELLIVPASISATSALSSTKSLYSMMSANYLTAGVGALLANNLLQPSRFVLGILAVACAVIAGAWFFQRKKWLSGNS